MIHMAVKIRLTRMGDKKAPFYRVVVADSRTARDGKVIDQLGYFNPLKETPEIKLDVEKTKEWLRKGALPTETAKTVLVKGGALENAKQNTPKKVSRPKKESKE